MTHQLARLTKLTLLGAMLSFSPQNADAAKCNKHCQASKKNKKAAEADCKAFTKSHPGHKCTVKKASLCSSGWKTLKSHKGKGTNYRSCIKKAQQAELNKQWAKASCQAYKKKYHKECVVKKGHTCGYNLRKIGVFGKGNTQYRSCRRKLKNEGLNKVRNAYNSTTFLVHAYKMYFRIASGGASTQGLPASLRKKYQKYYSVPLDKIRVGESSKINAGGGMTDCYKIYFKSGRRMLAQIKKGIFTSAGNETLFLHEMTHSDQCYRQGGRSNYAKLWFKHLALGALRNMANKQKAFSDDNLHRTMPMESNAASNAQKIQARVQNNEPYQKKLEEAKAKNKGK